MPKKAPTFHLSTLPNGLRILTAPKPDSSSVICIVMVQAGSRYETREGCGIAHFSEHMFFKGTERRPTTRDISSEVDAIGGEMNAFTDKENTAFFIRCAADKRHLALDVLSDMLRNSKFDPHEIRRERGVIIEEMNMYTDIPQYHVEGLYDRLLFGDQPLGWDIVGTKGSIRGAKRDTFLDYTKKWYLPSRIVVGLGGNLDGYRKSEIAKLLGGIAPGERKGPIRWKTEKTTGPRIRVLYKDCDQTQLILGSESYARLHADRYVIRVLATILGGNMSSRLFIEVREKRGLAYSIHSQNRAYADTGTFTTQAGVDTTRIDEAIKTILGEFQTIVDKPVPEDELTRAKECLKGRFLLSIEGPYGPLMFGLRGEVLDGHYEEPASYLAGIEAVTQEDVKRVAKKIIADRALHLAIIGPFRDKSRFEKLLK